jgi:hypothetical protein
VIPTYARLDQLREAVDSALGQTLGDSEVVVVDDGSPAPVRLPSHPRLRVVRLPRNRGGAAARNAGLHEARGRYVTYLDDDDRLLPHHLEVALDGLAEADLPPPVASLSGTAVISPAGAQVETRLPPTLPRGAHFSLEPPQDGRSFATKSTLVVEVDVLRSIGGWDEAFRSRVHTELFLRLNPVCSILGIPMVTYEHRIHGGTRVSDDPDRREESMMRLLSKHRAAFAEHPARHAELTFHQAMHLWQGGRPPAALAMWVRSLRAHPATAGRRTAHAARDRASYALARRHRRRPGQPATTRQTP